MSARPKKVSRKASAASARGAAALPGRTETMPWNRRHLLTLEELSRAEIEHIHAVARAFKRTLQPGGARVPALAGRTIVNLFLEPPARAPVSRSTWPPSASAPT